MVAVNWLNSEGPAVMAAATIVIAILTAFYVNYSRDQWSVMRDTLKLERPWIGQVKQRLDINPATNRVDAAALYVRNGGRSPAINIRYYLKFMIGPVRHGQEIQNNELPKATPCEKELPGQGGNVIVPNGEAEFPAGLAPQILARLDDIYSTPQKVGLYLVGCVDYTDTSEKPKYRTNFLLVIHPNSSEGIAILDTGNDAY